MAQRPPDWFRGIEIVIGLLSIVISMVIILDPDYGTVTVVLLLSSGLLFNAVRMIAAGGVKMLQTTFRGVGIVGGVSILALGLFVFFERGLGIRTLTFLLASGLIIQGLSRMTHLVVRGAPGWLRASAFSIGGLTVFLLVVAQAFPAFTSASLVILLTLVLLVNGIEGMISGIRPSNKKQLTLLKLVFFSIIYGFVNINWIDLFATSAPYYHIWLILTYMAPFGVLLVFQGLRNWQLAVSLGLLVSLVNDLGYFFTGNLFFGFHVRLIPWLAGQLGFQGNQVLFVFQGGPITFPVTSIVMGLSIYARLALVGIVLFHWLRQPSQLVA